MLLVLPQELVASRQAHHQLEHCIESVHRLLLLHEVATRSQLAIDENSQIVRYFVTLIHESLERQVTRLQELTVSLEASVYQGVHFTLKL